MRRQNLRGVRDKMVYQDFRTSDGANVLVASLKCSIENR